MKKLLIAGAIGAVMAVILGAFAAHGLKQTIPASSLATFETAVRYQMYHSLALLLLVALWEKAPARFIKVAGACFVLGVLLFSGSLYVLALTDITWIGPVTPVGGLSFIVGWLWLIAGAVKGNNNG